VKVLAIGLRLRAVVAVFLVIADKLGLVVINVALVLVAVHAVLVQVSAIVIDAPLVRVAIRTIFGQICLIFSNVILVVLNVLLLRSRILALSIRTTGEQTGKHNCERASADYGSAFMVLSPIEMVPEITTALTKSDTAGAVKFRHAASRLSGNGRRISNN
jgi:hypothetical protein